MKRRRSTPWQMRWSRPIMGAIALLGAILTAYLTIQKWTGQTVGCVAGAAEGGSCSNVLNSPYATVFGLPLSLYGFVAYCAIALFSLGPLLISPEKNKTLRNRLENGSWLLLLIQTTAMTAFSAYLMYVLAFELQTFCPYCIGSAFFSLTLLSFTLLGKDWEDLGQVFFTGIVVGMVTLVGTLGLYSNIDNSTVYAQEATVIPLPETAPTPPKGWEINTQSGPAEIALAEHLNEIGAKKYGAFWCPHCYEQKQLFGKTAFDKIDYIECDPRGLNPQPQACQDAEIRSYPSWEINGQVYRGTQPLERLAELSNYEGSMNFKYQLAR